MKQNHKTETALRTELITALVDRGVHAVRIESPDVTAGVPDVNVCIDGFEHWFELKRPPRLPMGRDGISPKQETWIKRRLIAGGKASIIIMMAERFFILPGDLAEYVNTLNAEEIEAAALVCTLPRADDLAEAILSVVGATSDVG